MNPSPAHRALYASFDRVPSPKGAATHIERFAGTLFDTFGGGLLYVLGDASLPAHGREGSVEVLRHISQHDNLVDRTQHFGQQLAATLASLDASLEICHFRDPWSGVPILDRPHRYRTVYEVNGLPSIELPSTYPLLSPRTLDKIRRAERFCWENADSIVTPSETIADNLVRMGAAHQRITVIRNGAEPVRLQAARPASAPERYLIYFGALQAWQGLDVLLQAFARLADLDLQLVICSSSHPRLEKPFRKLATRLGLDERIVWQHGLGRAELKGWVAHAAISVAPLTECARNLEQGCCPLKILESMAQGTPVVASDIPAVREILTADIGRLVHPGRPAELARALRVLLEYPDAARAMGMRGQQQLEQTLTWSASTSSLRQLYGSLLSPSPSSRPPITSPHELAGAYS
ncbi:glycosyltransferase family 4 protein [Uliginosibacterium sp. H3]|uniref:Glycosyltransferase family 4 protein n=1 Tax=Uliginosibacterium silvisoli TaxID=3114758 RepID=A0ABU6K5A9_9RHOO|nr:glycosyltransferase family 4 protein [Uliginosibacterium sp. H3]